MKKGHKGFKLFELALILAAIGSIGFTVIPQFTQAGTEEHIISTMGILHQIRSQIDLYKAQHNGSLPPAQTAQEFEKAMTQKDALGFGPYMAQIPANPFNGLRSVRITTDSDMSSGTHGWCYNPQTGDFYADDNKCHAQL